MPKPRKPKSGEIFEANSPVPERDRLDRALSKSAKADDYQREAKKKGRAKPGEVLEASGTTKEQTDDAKVKKFIHKATERFKLAAEAEAAWRREALDDFEFRIGKQWPSDIQTQRGMDGRPCLVMNRLPQYIRQITNEQRQNRPAGMVNPTGDGADVDTAEILQGCIRHVETNSDAGVADDIAFDHMVTCGLGWERVLTDYIDAANSDEQDIFVKPIRNPFLVYDDPAATAPDRSDARFRFIIEDVPISQYQDQYEDSEAATLNDFSSIGDQAPEWATRDTIRVAEYFYIEEEEVDGRKVDTVRWAKINAIEVLEGNENKTEGRKIAGKEIPIIPFIGDEVEFNGKRHISGLVRNAKDPQRMYNYWVSAATEMIALAPKAPFIGVEGQFEGHETEWQQSNNRNFVKLEYKGVSVAGTPVGPPQRQQFEPPVQSINLMTMQADHDMNATTGIYPAALGSHEGPEQSGKAILARQKESDVSNLNYSDNGARSIRHRTRVILSLIPEVYDTARVQRIFRPDQSVDHVGIFNSKNVSKQAAFEQFAENPAVKQVYDIGVGRYDVSVSVGPSYQSKRQEAAAAKMEMVKAFPQLMQIAGDLIVSDFDWEGSKELQKRLKKTIPPQLQDDDDTDPEAQVTKLQAQLAQQTQQVQTLQQAVQEAKEIIQAKTLELQSKERMDAADNQTKIVVAQIGTQHEKRLADIENTLRIWTEIKKQDFEKFKLTHSSAHEAASQAVEHSHEKELAELANDNQPEETTQ